MAPRTEATKKRLAARNEAMNKAAEEYMDNAARDIPLDIPASVAIDTISMHYSALCNYAYRLVKGKSESEARTLLQSAMPKDIVTGMIRLLIRWGHVSKDKPTQQPIKNYPTIKLISG